VGLPLQPSQLYRFVTNETMVFGSWYFSPEDWGIMSLWTVLPTTYLPDHTVS